jgi:hypothetical protein
MPCAQQHLHCCCSCSRMAGSGRQAHAVRPTIAAATQRDGECCCWLLLAAVCLQLRTGR